MSSHQSLFIEFINATFKLRKETYMAWIIRQYYQNSGRESNHPRQTSIVAINGQKAPPNVIIPVMRACAHCILRGPRE